MPSSSPSSLLQCYAVQLIWARATFDAKLMQVVAYGMFWCGGLVEDVDVASSWIPSRPIRQQIYALLLEGTATGNMYARALSLTL